MSAQPSPFHLCGSHAYPLLTTVTIPWSPTLLSPCHNHRHPPATTTAVLLLSPCHALITSTTVLVPTVALPWLPSQLCQHHGCPSCYHGHSPSHHRGCLVAILLSPPRLSPPPHTPSKTKKPRWWCTAFVWHTAARPSERLPARHGARRAPQGWPRALQRPRGACAGNTSRLDTRPGAGRAGMKPGRFVSRRGRCRPRDCRRGHGSESQGAQRPWPRLSDRLIPPGPAAQRPEASRHFLLTSARRGPADQIRSTCRGKVVWHLTLTH